MPGESISSIAQVYSSSVLSIMVENDLGSTTDVVESKTCCTFIYSQQVEPPPDDIDLLARLVNAEAGGGEPYYGQVAVAATVLNKISSPHYPDDVKGGLSFRSLTAITNTRPIWMGGCGCSPAAAHTGR